MHSRIAHTDLTIFNDEHIDRSKMCVVNLRICLSSDGQMHIRALLLRKTEQNGAEQNKTITQKETKWQKQQQTHSHDKFRAILLCTKTL